MRRLTSSDHVSYSYFRGRPNDPLVVVIALLSVLGVVFCIVGAVVALQFVRKWEQSGTALPF